MATAVAKKKGKKKKAENVTGSPALRAAVDVVADQFREAMETEGLTPAELADKMKVTESRVRQILDGRVISLRIIVAVLSALGLKFGGLNVTKS